MKRHRHAVLVFLLLLLVPACLGASTEIPECVPHTSVLLLFDVSPSTNNPEVRSLYLNSFDAVLEAADPGWQVAEDLIDNNPLAHSRFSFDDCIAVSEDLDPLTQAEQVQAFRQDARAGVQELLNPESLASSGTAILDSLQLAERYFATYSEAETRYLVFFSDMVEKSDRYTFNGPGLTPDAVAAFIEEELKAGRIPDLTGVEVYVVGAGATAAGGVSSKRFEALQNFWLSYIAATGANFPQERYGAALLRFP